MQIVTMPKTDAGQKCVKQFAQGCHVTALRPQSHQRSGSSISVSFATTYVFLPGELFAAVNRFLTYDQKSLCYEI